MLSGQNQAMGYNVFFAVVCLYCYGSIVNIAYLYKVVHQSWPLDHIVFKFQLRAHAKLIIPLDVTWNNKVICFVLLSTSENLFKVFFSRCD